MSCRVSRRRRFLQHLEIGDYFRSVKQIHGIEDIEKKWGGGKKETRKNWRKFFQLECGRKRETFRVAHARRCTITTRITMYPYTALLIQTKISHPSANRRTSLIVAARMDDTFSLANTTRPLSRFANSSTLQSAGRRLSRRVISDDHDEARDQPCNIKHHVTLHRLYRLHIYNFRIVKKNSASKH